MCLSYYNERTKFEKLMRVNQNLILGLRIGPVRLFRRREKEVTSRFDWKVKEFSQYVEGFLVEGKRCTGFQGTCMTRVVCLTRRVRKV